MAVEIKIAADVTRCDGFGKCVMAAPELFELGDDGKVKRLKPQVGPEQLELVRRAVYDCPVSALSYQEE
jgi:ferredoxin